MVLNVLIVRVSEVTKTGFFFYPLVCHVHSWDRKPDLIEYLFDDDGNAIYNTNSIFMFNRKKKSKH